jgi:hypothetical protein
MSLSAVVHCLFELIRCIMPFHLTYKQPFGIFYRDYQKQVPIIDLPLIRSLEQKPYVGCVPLLLLSKGCRHLPAQGASLFLCTKAGSMSQHTTLDASEGIPSDADPRKEWPK